jgi:hypothetical protein
VGANTLLPDAKGSHLRNDCASRSRAPSTVGTEYPPSGWAGRRASASAITVAPEACASSGHRLHDLEIRNDLQFTITATSGEYSLSAPLAFTAVMAMKT